LQKRKVMQPLNPPSLSETSLKVRFLESEGILLVLKVRGAEKERKGFITHPPPFFTHPPLKGGMYEKSKLCFILKTKNKKRSRFFDKNNGVLRP
jgi:hypothetical protein